MIGLQDLWSMGGILRDKNADNVPDGVNVHMHLEKDFHPLGLIDFCVRLGFETTSLSLDFINNRENDYVYEIFFKKNSWPGLILEDYELKFYYHEENALNELLRFLAVFHHDLIETSDPIKKIVYENEAVSFFTHENELVQSLQDIEQSHDNEIKLKEINSLTEVWNDLGFMRIGIASPINENSFRFSMDERLADDVWI